MTKTNTKILTRNAGELYAWYLYYKEVYSNESEDCKKLLAKVKTFEVAVSKLRKQKGGFLVNEVWAVLSEIHPEMAEAIF